MTARTLAAVVFSQNATVTTSLRGTLNKYFALLLTRSAIPSDLIYGCIGSRTGTIEIRSPMASALEPAINPETSCIQEHVEIEKIAGKLNKKIFVLQTSQNKSSICKSASHYWSETFLTKY